MIRQVCLVVLLCTAGVFSRTLDDGFEMKMPAMTEGWEGFIVGGQTATPGQFPHSVSLRSAANSHFCGAFIASVNWVVSAAHCTVGRTNANTQIRVGAHSLTDGTNVGTAQIINHAGYNGNTLANDISVLRTASTIVFSGSVSALNLGGTAMVGGGVPVIAAGWGRTVHNGPLGNPLQWLQVVTMTNPDCQAAHTIANRPFVHANTICTTSPVGQGMCNGDSGSGLFMTPNIAVGVVSWGIPCAQGRPDNFARISSHRAWITQQTQL